MPYLTLLSMSEGANCPTSNPSALTVIAHLSLLTCAPVFAHSQEKEHRLWASDHGENSFPNEENQVIVSTLQISTHQLFGAHFFLFF